jgi:polysaccharide pyruvyl transferase WcaK-like protein
VLIPNQDGYLVGRRLRRGDTDVARDIHARLADGQGVWVAETLGRPALETKALVVRCTALISPRYHACVAALTAGVPLLTLGWHEKYQALTSLYGQDRWMVPAEDCSFARLAGDFDALMAARDEVSAEIRSKKGMIEDAVVTSGKIMLGDAGDGELVEQP